MNLHNINTIARYEVKLLKRSWLFRIFAILALFGISITILGYQTALVNKFEDQWPKIAVTSLMPFCSVYFYNIAQSIIVIFLAGSFLKRDKKLDTAEVIYVRPMSNADYIIGKTWGIVKVFLSLNIISLAITAFFNVAINHSPFSLFPYLFYLLTISFPSLLFVLGLSFTVMCLLKNQAVTFIVMLGIIGTIFFYLSDSLYGVFDFFGVNIPSIFSDVTGHADLKLFLLQRLIYLFAGIGLISFTIALVKRLPHKPWKIIIVHTLGGCLVLAAFTAGTLYVLHYHHQLNLRNNYIETFSKYASENHVNISVHDLTIIPQGKKMDGKSVLKIVNNHPAPLDKIILYLNPSLQVSGIIESNGNSLSFTRENQVILIHKTLGSNEELALTLNYNGGINETICYTDVLEKDYLDTKIPEKFYRFGKRYAWLEDKFTLLTPECLWYPVSVAPVNPSAPYNLKKNFTDYTLTVANTGDKTVLSQGNSRKEGDKTIFTNNHALPGISLTIADYDKKSQQVDSVTYEILYFKGHDYFSQYFTKLNDTLPAVIQEIKNDIEIAKGRDYPFTKFVMAETPVQYTSYIRNWKGYTENVMPEIIFIPERGATLTTDFAAEKYRSQQWRRHDQGAPDETEMTIMNFRRFITSTFTDENIQYGWNSSKYVNPFNIAPLFFAYTSFMFSDEYPVLDVVINTIQNTTNSRGRFRMWGGIINDQQRANLYLEDHSFQTALSDKDLKPEIFYELLKLKSNAFKNYVYTQIPPEYFTEFLKEFFEKYKFKDIPFEIFKNEFEERYGIDLNPFLKNWYTEDHSPTVFIKDVDANQVVIDEVTKYQIKFKVNNPSDVDAIITAEVQQGGDFRGGGRRGGGNSGSSENTSETYIIPNHQAREIKLIVDERPAGVNINTNISHNLPTAHMFSFSKIDNTISDTIAGTFPIDPALFKSNPKEIIVDNEDGNFKTLESNTRHKLKDLFQKPDEEKYKNFMPWRMPSKWTAIAADYCYGETINSAVYKKKGSGNNSVEWEAELPKDGYYEVAIWNPKMSGMMAFRDRRRGREKIERNQTYLIQYEQEKESVTLDLEQEDAGWISLGNYYIPKGTAKIVLTDKVSGDYVIADAVKFTLADE